MKNLTMAMGKEKQISHDQPLWGTLVGSGSYVLSLQPVSGQNMTCCARSEKEAKENSQLYGALQKVEGQKVQMNLHQVKLKTHQADNTGLQNSALCNRASNSVAHMQEGE